MKNKVWKEIFKYFKVVIFLAVIVFLVKVNEYVLVRPGYIRYIIHAADNSETGEDYDCVVIGASHGRASIDPHYFMEMGYASNPINKIGRAHV